MYNMVMCVVSCGLRVVGGAAAGVHMWLWWWWWCVEEGEENEEEVGEQKVCMYVSHLRRDLIF